MNLAKVIHLPVGSVTGSSRLPSQHLEHAPGLLGAWGICVKQPDAGARPCDSGGGVPPPHLGLLHCLHAGVEVVDLSLHDLLVLLQLGLDPLQVLHVLRQLSHGVRVLLAQRGGCCLTLQGRLLQLPPQL